ncbi:MAG: amino acid racemase [Patescibacteria group bacterium]
MNKTIGVLGGMGPESTTKFYELLIEKYFKKKKDYAYPEIVVFSVDFAKIIKLQEEGNKKKYIAELMKGINALQKAGADFAVIASNTPHMVFEELSKLSKIPLLSIVKNTLDRAKKMKFRKLLLIGTKFTMQANFYHETFKPSGIEIVVPNLKEQKIINDIIYKNLFKSASKKKMIEIIKRYKVDGVILGCTELPLILTAKDLKVRLLDTLDIHAEATLEFALR